MKTISVNDFMFVNYIQEEMYMKKFGKKALLLVSVLGQSEDMWLCNDCVEELEDEGEQYGVDIEKK